MKSWIEVLDNPADWRRVVLHKLGGFVARLLLFGGIFLMHPGERCVYETDRTPPVMADVRTDVALQPAADASSPSDDLPPTF